MESRAGWKAAEAGEVVSIDNAGAEHSCSLVGGPHVT